MLSALLGTDGLPYHHHHHLDRHNNHHDQNNPDHLDSQEQQLGTVRTASSSSPTDRFPAPARTTLHHQQHSHHQHHHSHVQMIKLNDHYWPPKKLKNELKTQNMSEQASNDMNFAGCLLNSKTETKKCLFTGHCRGIQNICNL